MRIVGWVMVVIGLALPAPLITTYASEFVAVDRCLDGGGSYDYSRGVCDKTRNHPYVSFTARHPFLVGTGPESAGVGLLFAVVGVTLIVRASRRVA